MKRRTSRLRFWLIVFFVLPSVAYGYGVPPNDTICSIISCPTLTNPQDPLSYGAIADDNLDDSLAFKSAASVGDILVSRAGTYLINNSVSLSHGRHLRCSPGVILKNTDPTFGSPFLVNNSNGTSVIGCHFLGAQPSPTNYWIKGDKASPGAPKRNPGGAGNGNCFPGEQCTTHTMWNIAVKFQGSSYNLVAGNTFNGFLGQSELQNYGQTGSSNVGGQFLYNTFENCGLYGGVFTQSKNGRLAYNSYVDCAGGAEDDGPGLGGTGNVIEYNVSTVVNGIGYGERNGYTNANGYAGGVPNASMLTGGAAAGADYSTNTVRYCTIAGSYVWNSKTYRNRLWKDNGMNRQARYYYNRVINGAIEDPGQYDLPYNPPLPTIASLTLSSNSVSTGQSVTATVSITAPVSRTPLQIELSSSDTAVATTPVYLIIPSRQTFGSVVINASAVGTVTITSQLGLSLSSQVLTVGSPTP